MSTVNSTTKGTRLKRRDRQIVRAEVVSRAQITGKRAFQYAWDGDEKVQITGFPNGRATIERVDIGGVSVEPRRLLLAVGVPARYIGAASLALVLVAELVDRVVL